MISDFEFFILYHEMSDLERWNNMESLKDYEMFWGEKNYYLQNYFS